jgi:hypothetical protein
MLIFMKIKQKKHPKQKSILITMLSILVIVASFGVLLVLHHNSPVIADKKVAAIPTQSMFSFAGATDWRMGPRNGTSMALFGKRDADGMSPCFTSVLYTPGSIDIATKLEQTESLAMGTGDGSTTTTPLGTQTLTMQTTEGKRQYSLDQFKVASPPGQDHLMEGQEFGYLQLTNGYIKITGNCETADGLTTTIPALQAITFDSAQ